LQEEGEGEAGHSDKEESDRGVLDVEDDSKTVPWENDSDRAVGVALNGKTLAFLSNNQEKYDLVLKKVLHKA